MASDDELRAESGKPLAHRQTLEAVALATTGSTWQKLGDRSIPPERTIAQFTLFP